MQKKITHVKSFASSFNIREKVATREHRNAEKTSRAKSPLEPIKIVEEVKGPIKTTFYA